MYRLHLYTDVGVDVTDKVAAEDTGLSPITPAFFRASNSCVLTPSISHSTRLLCSPNNGAGDVMRPLSALNFQGVAGHGFDPINLRSTSIQKPLS